MSGGFYTFSLPMWEVRRQMYKLVKIIGKSPATTNQNSGQPSVPCRRWEAQSTDRRSQVWFLAHRSSWVGTDSSTSVKVAVRSRLFQNEIFANSMPSFLLLWDVCLPLPPKSHPSENLYRVMSWQRRFQPKSHEDQKKDGYLNSHSHSECYFLWIK